MGRARLLPVDEDLWELLQTESVHDIARTYGVTLWAVNRHAQRLREEHGLPRLREASTAASRLDRLEAKVRELEEQLALASDLEERIAKLERERRMLQVMPSTGGNFQLDHRRIADGGIPVREQRRRARAG